MGRLADARQHISLIESRLSLRRMSERKEEEEPRRQREQEQEQQQAEEDEEDESGARLVNLLSTRRSSIVFTDDSDDTSDSSWSEVGAEDPEPVVAPPASPAPPALPVPPPARLMQRRRLRRQQSRQASRSDLLEEIRAGTVLQVRVDRPQPLAPLQPAPVRAESRSASDPAAATPSQQQQQVSNGRGRRGSSAGRPSFLARLFGCTSPAAIEEATRGENAVECQVCFVEHHEKDVAVAPCGRGRDQCPTAVCRGCAARVFELRVKEGAGAVCPVMPCPGCNVPLVGKQWRPLADEATISLYDASVSNMLTLQCGGCHVRGTLFKPMGDGAKKKAPRARKEFVRDLAKDDGKVAEAFERAAAAYDDGKISAADMFREVEGVIALRDPSEAAKEEARRSQDELATAKRELAAWKKADPLFRDVETEHRRTTQRVTQLRIAEGELESRLAGLRDLRAGRMGPARFRAVRVALEQRIRQNAAAARDRAQARAGAAAPPPAAGSVPAAPSVPADPAAVARRGPPVSTVPEAPPVSQELLDETANEVRERAERAREAGRVAKELDAVRAELALATAAHATAHEIVTAVEAAKKAELQLVPLARRAAAAAKRLQALPEHALSDTILPLFPDSERRASLQLRWCNAYPHVRSSCCNKLHCFRCKKKEGHAGAETCDQYLARRGFDEVRLCPRCNCAIAKGDGCNSIRCSSCKHCFNWRQAEVLVGQASA